VVDQATQEVIEYIGLELETLLPSLDLKLPPGITGAQLLLEVLEGAPGFERDPALFSWFSVKILEAVMGNVHPDLRSELHSRIEARQGGGRPDP